MEQRNLHSRASAPATFSSVLRIPSPDETRAFGEKAQALLEKAVRPRVMLTAELHRLTKSPAFSWRAASALCSMFPSAGDGRIALNSRQKATVASAAKLMLSALRSSQDGAYMIARMVVPLVHCRKNDAAEFMDNLAIISEKNALLVAMALEEFPKNTVDQSLPLHYMRAFLNVYARGGEKPALRFIGLFREVSRFPESAKAMAESLAFFAAHMDARNAGAFVESFCDSWKKSLDSDVFKKNPPD